MNTLFADVLVLGAGLTGLSAAIACREEGLEVLVCAKNSPGMGNCTTVSQGAFSSSVEGYSMDDHKKNTFLVGWDLNEPGKVSVLTAKAEGGIKRLQKCGVKLNKRPRGFISDPDAIGKEGIAITKPLVEYAGTLGVRYLSPFFAWELVIDDGHVGGVWGFIKKDREPTLIKAKAVILAMGGAGGLFSKTDNPPGITGDGYALAYRAGLTLVDMEFVQFYPLSTAYIDRPNRFLPGIIAELGDLYNSQNESLVEKYNITQRPLTSFSRDVLSRAMALEVFQGRGFDGAVRLDVRNFEARWEQAKSSGLPAHGRLYHWFKKLLADRDYLPIMPVSHFFMGGVETDEACSTGITGFIAAGEVAGGLHGANRLGGNALSEAMVFGEIAGREAATYARGRVLHASKPLEKLVDSSCRELFRQKENDEKHDGKTLKKKIGEILWNRAGLIRSEDSLKTALGELTPYDHLSLGQVRTRTVFSFLELKNMLLVAEMLIKSSLLRKESRGSHFRLDYPQPDPSWTKHIVLYREKEEMRYKTI